MAHQPEAPFPLFSGNLHAYQWKLVRDIHIDNLTSSNWYTVFSQITTWDPQGWLLPQARKEAFTTHLEATGWCYRCSWQPWDPLQCQKSHIQRACRLHSDRLCCLPMANLLHHLHCAAGAISSADSASRTFQCLRLIDATLEGAGMHQELISLTPQDYILHGFEQVFIHDRAKCDAT